MQCEQKRKVMWNKWRRRQAVNWLKWRKVEKRQWTEKKQDKREREMCQDNTNHGQERNERRVSKRQVIKQEIQHRKINRKNKNTTNATEAETKSQCGINGTKRQAMNGVRDGCNKRVKTRRPARVPSALHNRQNFFGGLGTVIQTFGTQVRSVMVF